MGARAVEAGALGFVAEAGGLVAIVVGSGIVEVADAAVVFTWVSWRADHTAAANTVTTAQSRRTRRTNTASVCPVVRR